MADNVTTVPGLPDADFEKHPFPEENLLYIVQGTGADRDRKAAADKFFEWLISKKAMTTNNRDTRVGDIQFKIEETRGGKLLTAYILDGRTLEKPSVTGGMAVSGGLKVDSVEGTNQGQGTTKYLILGNTTVNGDLDVKYKAMLGNGLVVADPDEQKATVVGDLEVSGKVSAGSVEVADYGDINTTKTVTAANVVANLATVKNVRCSSKVQTATLEATGTSTLKDLSVTGQTTTGDVTVNGSFKLGTKGGALPVEVVSWSDSGSHADISTKSGNGFVLVENTNDSNAEVYVDYVSFSHRVGRTATQRKILSGGAALFFATSDGTYPYQQVIGG